jgi:CHAD domain-containing protein
MFQPESMNDFILKNKESAGEDIKRIINEQIDKALGHLEADIDEKFDESVHEIRKCVKRIRAAIRLIKDAAGKSLYGHENYFFRDINRNLSEIRSIAVIIETLNRLGSGDSNNDYRTSINHYSGLKDKIIYKLCMQENRLMLVHEMLNEGKERTRLIPAKGINMEILLTGFLRVYNQCLECMLTAKNEPVAANLHEWRKKIKYLYYQFQILNPVLPGDLLIYESQLDKLSEYLGTDHDLAELEDSLAGNPAVCGSKDKSCSIINKADESRQEKQKILFAIAGDIFDEKLKVNINKLAGG